MSELYYLQDSRGYTGDCLMFWCKDGRGYASGLDQLEQYTREEALRQNASRETDIPWPVDYINARAFHAVDCQRMKPEKRFGMADDCEVYVQASGDWNGNDVYWMSAEGKTLDLEKAKALTLGEAQTTFGRCSDFVTWPAWFIKSIARQIVHRQDVDIKQALKDTGIKLAKPAKPRKPTYRCEPCGRFLRMLDFYGTCPHCDATNY